MNLDALKSKLKFIRLREIVDVRPREFSTKAFVLICFCLFVLATGVRLLHWQNNLHTVDNTMDSLVARYRDEAQYLFAGDIRSFLRGPTDQPDQGILMHPPGYPIFRALVCKLIGYSDTRVRLVQILCDAAAAIFVFSIALLVLPRAASVVGGVLVAVSPQFANNSLPLLPDSLAALANLLAVYLFVRAWKRPRLHTVMAAGALIGVSCWLRANALLLAPFLCLLIFALWPRGMRLRYSIGLVGSAILVIAPITIRNAIVFRAFIPVSLSAGQNLVEGIADYDPQRVFGFESYDHLASRQEAAMYGRPDYAHDLYRPDGIERERKRINRALPVIRSNKIWFLTVMVRRAAKIVELEKTSTVSVEPTVMHSIEISDNTEPVWSADPTSFSGNTRANLSPDHQSVLVTSEGPDPKTPVATLPVTVPRRSDLLLRVLVKLVQGRMVLEVLSNDSGRTLASATIPDSLEPNAPQKDSMTYLRIPFVNGHDEVEVALRDVSTTTSPSILQMGKMEIYRLGPASYLWTRYPRWLLKGVQKFFRTNWMLPLTLLGVAVLALKRRWAALALILAVPAYYICAHSPLHVEPRYVVAIHYFFLMLAGLALSTMSVAGWQLLRLLRVGSNSFTA